jgi:glucose-1-phosphate thymidylyltransferase
MKAILLAGGYAKRLWPLTKDTPKPLLKVAGKRIIDYIVEKVDQIPDVDEIIVSTNHRFERQFTQWREEHPLKGKITLVIEPSEQESGKLGSVGGLAYVLSHKNIRDDTIIIGGDNIFGFSLGDFIDFSREKRSVAIALKDLQSKEIVKGRFGVAVVDDYKRLIDFQEKPLDPRSTLGSTACYVFPKEKLPSIQSYLNAQNNPDAMGHFISWLQAVEPVHGYIFEEEWFDIGSIEGLQEADHHYLMKQAIRSR